jgi:hypothetical protein
MDSDALRRLRELVEMRRDRLLAGHWGRIFWNLNRFLRFLQGEPMFKGILAELDASQKEVSAAVTRIIGKHQPYNDCLGRTFREQTVIAYQVLQHAAQSPVNETSVMEYLISSGDPKENLTELFLYPLCDYIIDQLDTRQLVLSQLVRYGQRCEWFDRERLYEDVRNYKQERKEAKKKALVEDKLKVDLYRYLHDQGVDFMIEPYSVGGEIDLIADQRRQAPKYIEVKVFDNEGKNATYLRTGFHQLFTYMNDYKTTTGYLVVYNLCKEHLSFGGDGTVGTTTYIQHDGKLLFVVIIGLYPHSEPASQRGTMRGISIPKDQLIQQPGQD